MASAGAANLVVSRGAFAQKENRVTFLLSSGAPLLAWAPHFLADALGYYKDEHLVTETIVSGSGPAALTALVAAGGNVAITTPGELLVAVARHQKLKVLMAQSNFNTLSFIISKAFAAKHNLTADMPLSDRLAAVKDFKGIRCGITSPGSITDHCARAVLAPSGLNLTTDAQIVPMQTTPNGIAAMSNGSIDAVTAAAPDSDIAAAKLDAVILFRVTRDEIPGFRNLSGHGLEVRAADVDQNPDLFAALVRANVQSFRYIRESPDAAGELLYKTVFASRIAPELWPSIWTNNISQFHTPYVARSSLEAWVTMGLLPGISDPKSVDIDSIFDRRFVDEAVRKIGWTVPA